MEGIDGSPQMVAKLRDKAGGADIPVTIGDFADVGRAGPFEHVLLVYNTLFNLLSQEAQVRCFENVADRLVPVGTFVVEAFVPDPARLAGESVRLVRLDAALVVIEAVHHDRAAQRLDHQRIHVDGAGVRLVPLPMRYAHPAEIDLMARCAGLSLAARFADWDRTPFTATSAAHISVYEKRS